jgi:hypothetical protein
VVVPSFSPTADVSKLARWVRRDLVGWIPVITAEVAYDISGRGKEKLIRLSILSSLVVKQRFIFSSHNIGTVGSE